MGQLFMSFFFLCILALSTAVRAYDVVLPEENSPNDPRQIYFIQLLELAFEKSNTPLRISYAKIPILQERALSMLNQGDLSVNLTWTMSSSQREELALPIRIPLLRGLLGARVCLVRRGEEVFSTLDEKIIIQGNDWPDTKILKANKFSVETATHYESLFEMLRQKRGDCFLRSITEVQKELESKLITGLALEKNYLIYYPAPMYFFVHRNNQILHSILEKGLKSAIKDGSFEKLFLKHYGGGLSDAVLSIKNRKIIRLSNPFLPTVTPLTDATLWYSFD